MGRHCVPVSRATEPEWCCGAWGENLMSRRSLQRLRPGLPTTALFSSVENEFSIAFRKQTSAAAGFNVVEAADGEEARRVIDSVSVNIVFADLSMPDQMKGLAFLHWLRKHHPATKAIVTSDTDRHAPGRLRHVSQQAYRLADLDYCLQRVLATLTHCHQRNGRGNDRRSKQPANPAPGNAQPGSVHLNGPPASDEADGRDNDVSKPSIAELSRRLAERVARQRAVDPAAARIARRAALEAYDRTRASAETGPGVGRECDCLFEYHLPCPDAARSLAPSQSAALPEPALLLSIAVATRR